MRPASDVSAPPASSRHHAICIRDRRFPFARARALAWDDVCQSEQSEQSEQGDNDLSTFLCRSALGTYFLLIRSGRRPDKPSHILPLSARRAAAWFNAHPVHFVDWDAPR